MLEPHAVVPMQIMTHGLTGLDPNLCSLYLSIQKVQSRACAFVAMSVRDMLIELQTTSIEIASQLAASHALLMKMQKDLQELKDALDPPPVVSKRDPPEAAETEDEREHNQAAEGRLSAQGWHDDAALGVTMLGAPRDPC